MLGAPLRPVLRSRSLGFAVTVCGTLVLTGNFDVARVGGAVPYVYALAGIGAAGVLAAFTAAWGRTGRVLALAALAAAIAGAGWWCTRAPVRALGLDPRCGAPIATTSPT